MSSFLQEPPLLRSLGGPQDIAVPMVGARQRDLLCALSYVYLACGQAGRALVLLRLVEQEADNDVGILRMLAYALVANGDGEAALAVIDRLQELDGGLDAHVPLLLMRSHALRLAGRLGEARQCFKAFTAARLDAEGETS